MTMLSRNDQKGRSMVEMLGVLAIIGVLSVGGISGYSKAMAKFKLTKAQDQITMMLMNIRTADATSPSYEDLNASVAAAYNIAPAEMISGSGSDVALNGAFGGRVNIGTLGTNNTYFYITMRALGREACRSLATSDWGADGLISMDIGTEPGGATEDQKPKFNEGVCTGSGTSGHFCTDKLPLGLTDLGTSSGALCGEESNYISWVYF